MTLKPISGNFFIHCIEMMEDARRVELTHSEDATDVIHKWLPFHYSFLFAQIRLPSLIVMC